MEICVYKMDAVSYDYKYENNTDKFSVTSKENLSYEMHVPTRSSKITSVKVNGTEVTDYTVDNFVNVKLLSATARLSR